MNNLDGDAAVLGLVAGVAIKAGIKPEELAQVAANKKVVGEYLIELMGSFMRMKLPKENE